MADHKIPARKDVPAENKWNLSSIYKSDEEWEEKELLEDTEKILSVLYTDYIASEEEKTVILNKEKIIMQKKYLKEIFYSKGEKTGKKTNFRKFYVAHSPFCW